jgi:cyanophycin synthetase
MSGGRQTVKRPPLDLDQLNDGEPLGHVIYHIALELQRLAGMPVYWGKSYPAREEGGGVCGILLPGRAGWASRC